MPSRLQDGFNLRTSEEKVEIERPASAVLMLIHISMRERPRHDGANKIDLAVSIHAPLRERLLNGARKEKANGFNSHLFEERHCGSYFL